jgi:flagellar basal-body rod modification protein FlgD
MATISGTSANTFPTPGAGAEPVIQSKATDRADLAQNFNQFLTLLTTQLKHQDPLSPMDSAQFTSQLVSFSQVEQQIKTNDNLAKLVSMTNTNQTTLGLSYIGLNVDMKGTKFEHAGTGSVSMAYTLPAEASVVSISIVDKDGKTVYTQSGDGTKGLHSFTWDGKDQNGDAAPAGVYNMLVGALDKDQKSIGVATTVPGYVSGIMTADDGTINLIIGRQSTQVIPLSSVTQASL